MTATSGKKPSGHQKRKAAREALDARLASEVLGAEEYLALGEPPMDDPSTGLEYVRRVQLVALKQVAQSAGLPSMQKWRLIRELTAAVGMTHARSALEGRVRQLEEGMRSARQSATVKVESAAKVAKPPTARGAENE